MLIKNVILLFQAKKVSGAITCFFLFYFFVVWCLGSSVLYDSSDAVGIRSKYSEKVDEGYTYRLQDGAINLRVDTLQAQTEATSS